MFDPNLSESDYNVKPTSLGSRHRTQEPWVQTPDPRALGGAGGAGPKTLGSGLATRSKIKINLFFIVFALN
jgi:hypothetical protein